MSNCCSEHKCEKNEKKSNIELIINIIGTIIFVITIVLKTDSNISLILFLTSYFLIGYEIIINAVKGVFKKKLLDENFLMAIATIGAFFIGEYIEGVSVLIFYRVGEFLQDLAVNKSKKRIEKALNLKPEYANLKFKGDIRVVDPKDLNVNDIIIVKAGEKVPIDCVVIKGSSLLDVKALTGETLPKEANVNDSILSGTINIESVLEVKVVKKFEDSTISKIIDLIENATNNKSESEKFITKFAKIYTPIVILIALIIAVFPPMLLDYSFTEYLRRSLIFLVVSCPCALVLSIPLSYFAGIGTCGKKGILIKGSNYLDALTNIKAVVFDKTGTLTKGTFTVTNIVSTSEMKTDKILKYIALCESYSNHPIAKSILESYKGNLDKKDVLKHEEIAGHGIRAVIDKKQVLVGNYKLLDKYNIEYKKSIETGTIVYLVIDNEYKGFIVVTDELKEDSKVTIQQLKDFGITNLVMLTGDNKSVADNISKNLKVTKVYSELLPQDKVAILNKIKSDIEKGKVVFIGDGINDSPVLAMADIGISMGAGSDIAIESSDIVLMTDEPSKLIDAIKIAKKTRRIVIQNIVFAIGIKVVFLILSGLGFTNMWEAVFADVGVSLLAVLNATRIMKK